MRRGDIVLVAVSAVYGKPRPAVIIQSDSLDASDSVLVCLVTGTLREAPIYRLSLAHSSENGLREPSQVMVEKIVAVRREKCGRIIGRLSDDEMISLNRLLGLVIGIAG